MSLQLKKIVRQPLIHIGSKNLQGRGGHYFPDQRAIGIFKWADNLTDIFKIRQDSQKLSLIAKKGRHKYRLPRVNKKFKKEN